jgi:hypothetical protein
MLYFSKEEGELWGATTLLAFPKNLRVENAFNGVLLSIYLTSQLRSRREQNSVPVAGIR